MITECWSVMLGFIAMGIISGAIATYFVNKEDEKMNWICMIFGHKYKRFVILKKNEMEQPVIVCARCGKQWKE